MFHYIKGRLTERGDNFVVVDIAGLGYKIYTSGESSRSGGPEGEEVKFFTYLHVREEIMDLYGFGSQFELTVFKKLLSISGIGPKSALALLNVAGAKELVAAINEGRPELLTRVAGIGKKTAERAVMELKDKIDLPRAAETVAKMESNADIEEALMSLGYGRNEIRNALTGLDKNLDNFQERLKEVLKILGRSNGK